MKLELDYLDELAKLMEANSLSELSLEDGGKKIALKRETGYTVKQPPIQEQCSSEPAHQKDLKPITSPMVGTFYASGSPETSPYVKVGDEIKVGQVVCIIEAMKLLNEIESDVSGTVAEICVENGQTIEFGQVLMYVE